MLIQRTIENKFEPKNCVEGWNLNCWSTIENKFETQKSVGTHPKAFSKNWASEQDFHAQPMYLGSGRESQDSLHSTELAKLPGTLSETWATFHGRIKQWKMLNNGATVHKNWISD